MIAIAPRGASWLGVLPLVAACAFGDGGGFTSLAPGELHGVFEAQNPVATDRGYRVEVNALSAHVHEFALLDRGTPEVSFDEIAHVTIDRELDLVNGEGIELAPFRPATELGAGTIARAELFVERLAVSAVVEGGSLAEPLPIEAQAEVEAVLAAELALVLGRDVPERIAPVVVLRAGGTLFDRIDFGALNGDTAVVESRLAEWITTAELEVDLGVPAHTRVDPALDDGDEGHSH